MRPSVYSLRKYNENTQTNVCVSTFHYVTDAVMVAKWTRNDDDDERVRFLLHPSPATNRRFLELAPNELLCVYHRHQLLMWTSSKHAIAPSFAVPSSDEEEDLFIWLVKGPTEEICKDALLVAQRLFSDTTT
jgi:hypothetical protein